MQIADVRRITTTISDQQGNNVNAGWALSPDGTKLLFRSNSTNLVPGDTNNLYDLFVKDLQTGAVTMVTSDSAGNEGNQHFNSDLFAAFSPDSSKVLFTSAASNLVAGDTNGSIDVFVKDLATGVTTRVSTDAAGNQATLGGGQLTLTQTPDVVFTPDGTKVAFLSASPNLVPNDTNGTAVADIFVKNLATGAITLVSSDSAGNEGNKTSIAQVFSPDGTKIAFLSDATNLVAGDTNNATDIFIKTLATGAITRVSTSGTGVQGDGNSLYFDFSPDGSKIVFYSLASNFAAGDTNARHDVFIKDLSTGAVTMLSVDSGGNEGNDLSYLPQFSPDGHKVAFLSSASNLLPGDTNGRADIFVKNLDTGVLSVVTSDAAGNFGNFVSDKIVFSPDSTKIAFISGSSNLVPGDTNFNGFMDVFVKDLATGEILRTSVSLYGAQADSSSLVMQFSPDGSKLYISSQASTLISGDTNGREDVFEVAFARTTDDTIHGAGLNDRIFGGTGKDSLYGEGGDDYISGGGNSDKMYGGAGNDTLRGDSANDTQYGGSGDDTYRYDSGLDKIIELTGEGDDIIRLRSSFLPEQMSFRPESGGAFSVVLDAGVNELRIEQNNVETLLFGDGFRGNLPSWATWLFAGAGGGALNGSGINDTIVGRGGVDTINGGSGQDSIHGGAGGDTIRGGGSSDKIYGGEGDDILYGDTATDRLYGGNGLDRLEGGAGNDTLTGGAAADTFVFTAAGMDGTSDMVEDFSLAQGDRLDIQNILPAFDPNTQAITDFLQMTTVGANTVMKIDVDGTANGVNWVQVAVLGNATGLTDEQALVNNGTVIV